MSKILLIGGTGYVGGTVLAQLLSNTSKGLAGLKFDLLVRSKTQAQKLRDAYGDRVHPILWKGLEDTAFIEETAAQYDIIVNAGCGFIAPGAKAFVEGLSRRVKDGSSSPWFIHTSGCTNLVDRSQKLREWNDEKDGEAIFNYLKELDEKEPYPQRTTEVTVLETAANSGVQAVSLQAGLIYGEGKGLFNKQGLVVPMVLRYVVEKGYGVKLNDTANFDTVHVIDLADYYVLLVSTILERPDRRVGYIPTGKAGVLFPTVGRVLITGIHQKALDVAFAAGDLPRPDTPQQKEVRVLSLQEMADELTAGQSDIAERGWGGEKAVKGTIGQKLLGWKPTRLDDAWSRDFENELVALKEGKRGDTMRNTIGKAEKAA